MTIGLSHVEELANEINELYDCIKKNHLDIAERALNGSKGLSSDLKKELHRRLKMDKFKFSRYVFIGRRLPELRPMEEHLPGGYTLILAIAKSQRHQPRGRIKSRSDQSEDDGL